MMIDISDPAFLQDLYRVLNAVREETSVDLNSGLCTVETTDGRLSGDEIVPAIVLAPNAGHEATEGRSQRRGTAADCTGGDDPIRPATATVRMLGPGGRSVIRRYGFREGRHDRCAVRVCEP